jgi:hypothetical protein
VNPVAPDAGLLVTARSYGPPMTTQLIPPAPGSNSASALMTTHARRTSDSLPVPSADACERIREVARCLRTLEQQCSGMRRERWGYAAANAEAAAAAAHPLILRWLWATACDYARRAAEGNGHAPIHPMRWSSRTPG